MEYYILNKTFQRWSRTAATSKMGHFAIITKSSILDAAAVLDPPQLLEKNRNKIKTTLHRKMLFQKTKSTVTANKNLFIQLFSLFVR